ncbi:hypothetical protein DYQ86_04035 [Acidobacteria bacterium AB60]|nr:hypothetical protein DYQ86_04035 [Acidobacteria bacterium AB60]
MPHWRTFRLWLPLFLLWIPLILLSPIILIVVVAVCLVGRVSPLRALGAFWAITCSLPGTEVTVHTDGNHVRVKIL